VPLSLVPAT